MAASVTGPGGGRPAVPVRADASGNNGKSQSFLDFEKANEELKALVRQYETAYRTYMTDVSRNILSQWSDLPYPAVLTTPTNDAWSNAYSTEKKNTRLECFNDCDLDRNCGYAMYSDATVGDEARLCIKYYPQPGAKYTLLSQEQQTANKRKRAAMYTGYTKPSWADRPNINAISPDRTPPLGDGKKDIGNTWKYLGDANSLVQCQTKAMTEEGVFTQIVYVNDDSNSAWHKACYGKLPGGTAPSYSTYTPKQWITSTPPFGYTKLGIGFGDSSAQLSKYNQLLELKKKIELKRQEIAGMYPAAVGRDKDAFLDSQIDQINGVTSVRTQLHNSKNQLDHKREQLKETSDSINLYDYINKHQLVPYKYRYALYAFVAFLLISIILSYVSDLSIFQQITAVSEFIKNNTWKVWWGLIILILWLFIISLGWDAQSTIKNFIRNNTPTAETVYWFALIFVACIIYVYYEFYGFAGQKGNNMGLT